MNSAVAHQQVFQVSELLSLLHLRIDSEFGAIRIEGEVSGLSQPRSGHRYFSLKDRDGQLRCAWFRQHIRGQSISEGQSIIAHGRLAIYSPRGDLQLIVSAVEDAGEGALALAFARLKKQLAGEGLFDADHKPPCPAQVHRLAIISSPQAAALQDVRVTLARRDPFIQTRLHGVSVQGAAAPAEICAALRAANEQGWAQVILLTRGGGSLEDLQAFNDESVARAIAASAIPVVSAVGHETDFSISDFVASLRCATPTAAAEQLSQDRGAQMALAQQLRRRLISSGSQRLRAASRTLQQLIGRLERRSPQRQLDLANQRLDLATHRLARALARHLASAERGQRQMQARLERASPSQRLKQRQDTLHGARKSLHKLLSEQLEQANDQLTGLRHRLYSLNPRAVLERGYTIVHSAGTVVEKMPVLERACEAELEWADGRMSIRLEPKPPKA